MEKSIEKLQEILDSHERTVFFGGAGVSTESGIPDFRSVDGLYHQKYDYPPETILSHTFFMKNPEEFFRFYRDKMLALDAKPNEAHKKLAQLEKAGKLTGIVTQNIDGLHQAAGSVHVMELHGSVHRNYCMRCGKFYDAHFMKESSGIPTCTCGGIIKPDVVLYEEGLDQAVLEGCGADHLPGSGDDRGGNLSGGVSGGRASGLFQGRRAGGDQQGFHTQGQLCGSGDPGAYREGVFPNPPGREKELNCYKFRRNQERRGKWRINMMWEIS